jgi:hypothetical protein
MIYHFHAALGRSKSDRGGKRSRDANGTMESAKEENLISSFVNKATQNSLSTTTTTTIPFCHSWFLLRKKIK